MREYKVRDQKQTAKWESSYHSTPDTCSLPSPTLSGDSSQVKVHWSPRSWSLRRSSAIACYTWYSDYSICSQFETSGPHTRARSSGQSDSSRSPPGGFSAVSSGSACGSCSWTHIYTRPLGPRPDEAQAFCRGSWTWIAYPFRCLFSGPWSTCIFANGNGTLSIWSLFVGFFQVAYQLSAAETFGQSTSVVPFKFRRYFFVSVKKRPVG